MPTKIHLVKAMVFPVVMYGCESWTIKKIEHQRLMLLNCGVGEDSWEAFGQQGDWTSQSERKSTLNIHWKDWCWSWSSSILATWCEEPTHWKNPDVGQNWGQEEKGATEDEMFRWHHWLNGHEFEQTQGDSDGQRSLACCSPCRIEHDLATEQWQQAEAFMQAAWTEQWGRRFEVSPGQDRSLNCVSARYRQWS